MNGHGRPHARREISGQIPGIDHHLADDNGNPQAQERGAYYAAADAKTCLAEVFQVTRRIDRVFQAPWLVVFETLEELKLLGPASY